MFGIRAIVAVPTRWCSRTVWEIRIESEWMEPFGVSLKDAYLDRKGCVFPPINRSPPDTKFGANR